GSERRARLVQIEEERRRGGEKAEKARGLTGLIAEARGALDDRRFEAALGLLSQAREIEPAAPELNALLERANGQQEEARIESALVKMLAEVNERIGRGDLSAAAELLDAAPSVNPADTR